MKTTETRATDTIPRCFACTTRTRYSLRDARTRASRRRPHPSPPTRRLRAYHRARRLHLLRRRRGEIRRQLVHVHAPVVVREAEEVLSLSPPASRPPSGAVSANSSDVIFSRLPNASTRVGSLGVGDRRSNAERTHRSSRTKNADGRAGDQRTATTFPGVTPSHRRTAADDDVEYSATEPSSPAARNARGNVGLKCKDTTGDTPPPPTPAPASRGSRGTNDLGGGGAP